MFLAIYRSVFTTIEERKLQKKLNHNDAFDRNLRSYLVSSRNLKI